ncbi:MAG: hypothetical protein ACRCWR_09700 [Saezia sp.]
MRESFFYGVVSIGRVGRTAMAVVTAVLLCLRSSEQHHAQPQQKGYPLRHPFFKHS